ncbi:MAG: hypothetical protein WD473_11075 [Acidimicrobiia bacterium]
MSELLEALANGEPPVAFHDRPEWAQAREWGWIMESGELTGTGNRHAGEIPTGILPPHQ